MQKKYMYREKETIKTNYLEDLEVWTILLKAKALKIFGRQPNDIGIICFESFYD